MTTEESLLEAVKEIGRKIDELRELLEDVLLSAEEYLMIKEIDEIVEKKRLDELVSLDELQDTPS
ncbi:hypothetical protein DRO24_01185 [Candidatus Bathyarchaeota archaeon]|nr:hypothetical protein [Candidatus Bathyarchaeota archaeon]RLI08498.1 MAG: hypothetical protein DRO24_01185 [Candidatus Bathyarchaeota archaeon]